jgi:predicted NBD/HSP70 family sugar kinase
MSEGKHSAVSPRMLRASILHAIRSMLIQAESATQAELSAALEVSFPTISKFLAELVATGEVRLAGTDASSGGRRAKRYAYNPEFRLGLALYLEQTESRYRVFNSFGQTKESRSLPGVLAHDPERLFSELDRILASFPGIRSLAVGVPGAVNQGTIIHIPEYVNYRDVDLQALLEARYGLPAVVENDMNAAVYGYFKQQGDVERSSLVYLYSGQNGAGAGIVIGGQVVRGSTFFSGEVAFVPLYNDRNFVQALGDKEATEQGRFGGEAAIDALSRLLATFTAVVNPHVVVMGKDEVDQPILDAVAERSSRYIPRRHLPELVASDWQRDYLDGLQQLGLEKMILAADGQHTPQEYP